VRGVVLLRTSQFVGEVAYRLQPLTLILLQDSANSGITGVSFEYKGALWAQIRYEQQRLGAQTITDGLKGRLTGSIPDPRNSLFAEVSQG